jgi:immune inhibitor A
MKPRLLVSLCLAGAVIAVAVPAGASRRLTAPDLMPLDPEIVQSYGARGLAVPIARTEARFAGRPGMTVNRVRHPASLDGRATTAATTNVRAIVLLVGFTDPPPGGPTVRFRPTVWDSMLFGDTYIRGGADTTTIRTLRRFYRSVSYGAVDIVTLNLPGSVGWLTAPHAYNYYCNLDNGFGAYPHNAQRLVMDAVIAADPYVDFSQYATGGVVRNLFVVHAGSGAEWGGGDSLIWSHAWSVDTDDGFGHTPPALYADGVKISDYSMEPEAGGNTTGEGGARIAPLLPTVGVYAHEFGHVLGLPDEYDYGYESRGTGYFSLMAGGSWNRMPNVYPDCAGNSPARPGAWALEQLGFVTPTVVTEQTNGITLPPVSRNGAGSVLKVVYPGSNGSEYWLFENRQQTDFDQGFIRMGSGAHGLLVYHVDENVMARTYWLPNEAECVSSGAYRGQRNCDCDTLAANASNGEKWYGISVEQADGLYQLELNASSGAPSDFYPGAAAVTSFGPATTPSTSSYYRYGGCTGFAVATNIAEAGGNVTLDLTADVRTHVLTVTVDGGGSVQADPVRAAYQHGSTVTLTALPGVGYTFSGWRGDTTLTANPLALPMYADRSVTAAFTIPTAVGDERGHPLALAAPRPSPMRATAEIGFSLPREMAVRLSILDLQGRELAVLATGVLAAGPHGVTWDGGTDRGAAPAGLYFARLAAGGRVLAQRLVRLQ